MNGGLAPDLETGKNMIRSKFRDGSALETFLNILKNQGVSEETAEKLREGK